MTDPDCCPSVRRAPTCSLEVLPAQGAHRLADSVVAVRKLLETQPDFVTVTYGAGGASQQGTKEFVAWIAATGVPTYAHLTCQAQSLASLDATIDDILALGVTGFLALRGDARDDGTGLVLPHANDLVQHLRRRADAAGIRIQVAVAAFPNGHPESSSLEEDALTALRKQDAGADFAITQNVFYAADYERFMGLVDASGCTLPIIPGLMPPTSARRVEKIAELSGIEAPTEIIDRLRAADSADERRFIAIERTVALADQLIAQGAPGIQLFTMNDELTNAQTLRRLRADTRATDTRSIASRAKESHYVTHTR